MIPSINSGAFLFVFTSSILAAPWEGTINKHRFYVPDISKPVKGVLIDNSNDPAGGSSGDLYANADWRALAIKHNLAQTEWDGRYDNRATTQAAATEIVNTLKEAAKTLNKPEIEFTAIFPQGLSGTACDAAWIASFPEFKNRVGAVIAHHEADVEAPAGVPAIYIGDGQDQFGKCCDITQIETVASYAKAGHPATVSFEPGQSHPSPAKDEKFVCAWLDEMIQLRFPTTISSTKNVELPDWNNKTAWIGGYTSSNSSESPWNGGRKPINVWISNQANYTGSEKWIWLPSQRIAELWKTYMETGSIPNALSISKPSNNSFLSNNTSSNESFRIYLNRELDQHLYFTEPIVDLQGKKIDWIK